MELQQIKFANSAVNSKKKSSTESTWNIAVSRFITREKNGMESTWNIRKGAGAALKQQLSEKIQYLAGLQPVNSKPQNKL